MSYGRKRTLRLLGGLCGLLLLAPVAAAELVAHFRLAVRVDTDRVVLGEVVRLIGEDAELWAREPLLHRLAPGEARQIQRSDIERVLEKAGVAVRWRGIESTVVQREPVTIPAEQVVARAQQALEGALRELYQDVVVRPARQRLQSFPVSDMALRLPAEPTARRRMAVFIDSFDGDRALQSVPIWFEVEAYQSVLVAGEEIPARTMLRPELLKTERRDVAALARPLLSVEDKSYWAVAPIAAGAALTTANAAPAPPVRADQPVEIVVAVGAVQLRAQGTALNNGFIGDEVRVARLQGAGQVAAQVVGDGMVLVR